MPFIGLVITSAGFLIPFVIAHRKKDKKHMVLSSALACTSLWFHGIGSHLSFVVDKAYAHTLGTIFWIESLQNFWKRRRRLDVIFVATTNGIIYVYFCHTKGRQGMTSHLWHMAMHVIAIGGWVGYLLKK
jgi:hypothetical protein